MKLIISLFIIAIITACVYLFVNRNRKSKKNNSKALGVSALVAVMLLGLLVFLMYKSATAPDMQCIKTHETTTQPPANLQSAMDYYQQANFDYDTGNCKKAITHYTASIKLDPTYPQAYNNRAYTYMRMQNYQAALPDLEKALQLKPDYIQALMNRGDIHNYYYQIDRQSAVADYKRVLSLGGAENTSVCGHLFLAEHNGWNLGTFIDLPRELMNSCH